MGKLIKYAKIGIFSLAVLTGLALLGLSLPIGGRRAMSVQTGSMEPTIKTGSLVFVNRVSVANIAPGDIITYINPRNSQQTITHRVAEVRDRGGSRQFITKGDANPSPDQPISEKRVVGKVNGAVPYVGKARDFLFTWPGLVLFVYIPALIVSISEIRRLAAVYRARHYELPEIFLRRTLRNTTGRNLAIAGATAVISVLVALPVLAAKQSTATLTGNTISTAGSSEPEPPEPPQGGEGDVTLRRAFVACEGDADEATHVQLILYNATDEPINMSGWYIQSGANKLITFPDETMILGRSLFDAEGPIVEGISYSSGNLKLFNTENEQIDEHSWELPTTRACRVRI
jgi:signal peptidase I